ncbi:Fe2+-dependent dioxygenase [Limnobacter humi]|uniref:Fe2+-dependent dioxygenase n=1 Tax=Limnobacter humi TaxID=1778671 RepID=A0ABT1WGV9_9BURK|nr:Fe2+-dependent dioxygenase [Limnobacter humi]MCQ8896755.1 Fe2+-dependent dioxygenase [Limnobacter humi]
MLIVIPKVLNADELDSFRTALHAAEWTDGKATAGTQSAAVKVNQQLPELSPVAQQLGNRLLKKLGAHPLFLSAALPKTIYPPLFNRYRGGEHFGVHVDNAIRPIAGTSHIIRTDLSATLFLMEPDSYDGGELVIETQFGSQAVKLNAGDMVLYSASSLHQVNAVTHGERLAAFFWLQSLVRDDGVRQLLFDLDQSIQELTQTLGQRHNEVVRLTGVYHNLMRRYAEV